MEQIWAKTVEWIKSKTLLNFGFHLLSATTESHDSVSSVAGRPTRGWPVAAVRRRRPRLSAPTPSLGRHDATQSLGRPHFAFPAAANQQPRPRFPRRLRPSQPAKRLAEASSTSASPPRPLSSMGKAALPSSEPFILVGVPPELTGDVARPLCSTISLHSCS